MTGVTDAEARQARFDDALERVRLEGVQAHADGLDRDANPYRSHPEPHFANAWAGGMAEAKLELLLVAGTSSPSP